jgi:uncharacterized protein (TIGR04552 family)
VRESLEPAGGLRRLEDFDVFDLETIRLLLRGGSVIDWHRLNLDDRRSALELLRVQEFRPDEPADRARLQHIQAESIAYLRRNFDFPVPKPVENASVEELLVLASGRGHRQMCACSILKIMHIIHHLDGRELLYVLPLSDAEIFHMVEEKVYRVIGGMLARGFPIIEFLGGRKNKDSLYTKLLSKQQTIAAQIYDKLRFRVVTRSVDDIFPILNYLTRELFPFNYVIPGESTNTIFRFSDYCSQHAHLRRLMGRLQVDPDLENVLTPSQNEFSASDFKIVHFVVDLPVRLTAEQLQHAPPSAWSLGAVIFVLTEIQIIDRETETRNELGESSHAKYKERQKRAVMRRLQLGAGQTRVRRTKPPPDRL